MGTTPGGLPYPESSDPVAGGADAIKALALAVDLAIYWEPITQPPLNAGWTWSATGGVQRRKDGKWVMLRGQLNYSGTTIAADIGTTVFTLPAGYRPSAFYRVPISTGTSASIRCQIGTDGQVIMTSSAQIASGGYWQPDNVLFATTATP